MAVTAQHHRFGGPVAWGAMLSFLFVIAVAFAGAYWLLNDNDGTTEITVPSPATAGDGIIPHGAELSRPVITSTESHDSGRLSSSVGANQHNTLYLVNSAEEAGRYLLYQEEANRIRSYEGLPPITDEFVPVAAGSTDGFMNGLSEANRIRFAEGLPPIEVIDLR